ncbi:MAG: BMP family ABC transporter substrate-binding protein, partial [Anaerovorax sp.]
KKGEKGMKKLLAMLVILAMVFSLAACGNKDAEPKTEPAVEPELTVGFIYIGTKNDGGFTQAQHNGTVAMEKHFGGKVKVLIKESVPDTDKQAAKEAAIGLIDQGAKVIFGCSFGFMDALEELSKDEAYKDIDFLHFSGYKMNDTNFGNYFGATEEPRYLTGIVAGLETKSDKIGYVAAHPYTEVQIGIDAFTLGVQSVNPDAQVKVVYINSWYDPVKEKEAAQALLQQGCDVITQHCDTTGPQTAAAEKGALAIGYNLDNSKVVPEAFLTAPTWHHEVFLIPTIEAIMDGTWKPESYYGTMKDGYMDIAPLTALVSPETKAKVEEVQAKMMEGNFPIFVGPIKDNTGAVRVPEGQTLDREGIWEIDYLVEGATN